MKKRLLVIAMATTMMLSLAGCGGSDTKKSSSDSASDGDTIKIGVLLSTTGDFSISETPMKNCAEMAINEINDAGGIDGKKIEAIYTDYGSDPSMAAEKAQELIL